MTKKDQSLLRQNCEDMEIWSAKNGKMIRIRREMEHKFFQLCTAGEVLESKRLISEYKTMFQEDDIRNARGKDSWTVMHYGCSSGSFDCVHFLTRCEFDVDKEGKNVILFSYFLILSLIYFLILPY
jgi:hypothetical protein